MIDITEFMRSEQKLESNYDSVVHGDFNEHDYLEKTTKFTQNEIVNNENHLKDDYTKIPCQKSGLDDFVEPNKDGETSRRRERRKFRDRSSERGELRERSRERGELRERSSEKGKLRDRSRERGELRERSSGKRKSRGRSAERGRLRDRSRERGNSRGRSIDRGKSRYSSRERGKSRGTSRERRKSRDRILDKGKSRDRSRDRRRSRDRSGKRRKWRGESRERGQLRDNSPCRGERKGRNRKEREGKWRGKGHGMGKSRNRSEDRGRWREKSRDTSRENSRDGSPESGEIRVNRRARRDRDSRSRSRSRHERETERELLLEREQELELEDTRRFKENKETLEPEADPGRDQRTVSVYEMSKKATERDVHEFFSKAGKVKDVRLIVEKNSGFSKGFGYIEFYDVISVPMAMALSGQLLLGEPVTVKPYEAEENLVQTNASGGSSDIRPSGTAENRVLAGNLHFSMTEIKLKKIFEAFGPVESIQLPLDPETGHCKGFGVVQFSRCEHAREAHSLNGKLEITGRMIKVSSVTNHILVQDSGAKAVEFDDDHHHHYHEGGGLASLVTDHVLVQDSGAKAEDVDDERGGLGSSVADHILVQCSGAKTADDTRTASSVVESIGTPMVNGADTSQLVTSTPIVGTTDIPAPVSTPQVPKVMTQKPIGKASEYILVMNMFDPDTEDDPEFDLDIKDDVHYECSKYGRVEHIHVDKNSAGYVYVRLNSVEGALISRQAMHNRLFGGRLISAIFLQPDEYHAKFKDEG